MLYHIKADILVGVNAVHAYTGKTNENDMSQTATYKSILNKTMYKMSEKFPYHCLPYRSPRVDRAPLRCRRLQY